MEKMFFYSDLKDDFVLTDVGILANKVQMSLQAVHGMQAQLSLIDKLEHSYVSASTRQLVGILLYVSINSVLSFEKRI